MYHKIPVNIVCTCEKSAISVVRISYIYDPSTVRVDERAEGNILENVRDESQ